MGNSKSSKKMDDFKTLKNIIHNNNLIKKNSSTNNKDLIDTSANVELFSDKNFKNSFTNNKLQNNKCNNLNDFSLYNLKKTNKNSKINKIIIKDKINKHDIINNQNNLQSIKHRFYVNQEPSSICDNEKKKIRFKSFEHSLNNKSENNLFNKYNSNISTVEQANFSLFKLFPNTFVNKKQYSDYHNKSIDKVLRQIYCSNIEKEERDNAYSYSFIDNNSDNSKLLSFQNTNIFNENAVSKIFKRSFRLPVSKSSNNVKFKYSCNSFRNQLDNIPSNNNQYFNNDLKIQNCNKIDVKDYSSLHDLAINSRHLLKNYNINNECRKDSKNDNEYVNLCANKSNNYIPNCLIKSSNTKKRKISNYSIEQINLNQYSKQKKYKCKKSINSNNILYLSSNDKLSNEYNECNKNYNYIRNKYYTSLVVNNLWIKKDTHNNITILDWDDTLLCTTFLTLPFNGVFNENIKLSNKDTKQLSTLEDHVFNLLTKCINNSDTYIVTNASAGWVEYSSARFYPKIITLINKNITIISARELFEKKNKTNNMRNWKLESFKLIIDLYNKNLVTNFICIGDSFNEMEAGHTITKHFKKVFIKYIKFKESPKLEELIKQVYLVNMQYEVIFSAIKCLTVTVQKKDKSVQYI